VQVKCDRSARELLFRFTRDDGDGICSEKVRMRRDSCVVRLPNDAATRDIHGDLLALAAILMVYPFTKDKLVLSWPISQGFADRFAALTGRELMAPRFDLEMRRHEDFDVPSLAFSGGTDSTAALALLPDSTVVVFLNRLQSPEIRSIYRKDAAIHACNVLRSMGRRVETIETDLEYLRDPVGFPVDVSTAVPVILLADYCQLDSVAFGTVLESAYRVGHEVFMNYAMRHHYACWGGLFDAVGLPFNQVVAGVSEVGTSLICLQSPYGRLAQSCIRGDVGKPCNNCWKCFRKLLLEKTLTGKAVDASTLDEAFVIKEATAFLEKPLIKHQNVIEYIAYRYPGDDPRMNLLKEKVCLHGDLECLERWYSPSLALLPARYKEITRDRICSYLEPMSPGDEQQIRDWDMRATLQSEEYATHCRAFEKVLSIF
jgi:hypothetical protein